MQGPLPGTVNYGYVVPSSYPNSINNSASNGSSFNKGSKRHLQITNQVRALQLEDDSRRPCSNSSSTSDCSSGSHSPPETPSLPLISEVPCDHHLDRGKFSRPFSFPVTFLKFSNKGNNYFQGTLGKILERNPGIVMIGYMKVNVLLTIDLGALVTNLLECNVT